MIKTTDHFCIVLTLKQFATYLELILTDRFSISISVHKIIITIIIDLTIQTCNNTFLKNILRFKKAKKVEKLN